MDHAEGLRFREHAVRIANSGKESSACDLCRAEVWRGREEALDKGQEDFYFPSG